MATLHFTYEAMFDDDGYQWRFIGAEGAEKPPSLRFEIQEYKIVSGDIGTDTQEHMKKFRDDWEAAGHSLVYRIEPFSGLDFQRNADKCGDGETPCAICGKPVKDDSGAKWLSVGDGNSRFLTPDEAETDPEAGAWPVGPGCWRKHRAVLKQYGPS